MTFREILLPYFEYIPDSQVHGRRARVEYESSSSKSTADVMMPWRGDKENLIDRFDVRANLDYIDESKPKPIELSKDEMIEERRCNYERYKSGNQGLMGAVDHMGSLSYHT